MREKKHRVEDALSTARAAVAEGIVPGGGVALINAIPALDKVQTCNDDEQFGVQILRRALEDLIVCQRAAKQRMRLLARMGRFNPLCCALCPLAKRSHAPAANKLLTDLPS